MRLAAPVLGHYMRSMNDYGDVIRHTISKCREQNQVELAKALIISLVKLFQDLLTTSDTNAIDKSSQDYTHLKELARRFALTFGLEQIRIRDAIACMHKDGIDFALQDWPEIDATTNQPLTNQPPPNLNFLEILLEFSSKLMRQDRNVVMSYLKSRVEIGPNPSQIWSQQNQHFVPLMTYKNSLLQGVDDHSHRKRGKTTAAEDEELSMPPTPFRQEQQEPEIGSGDASNLTNNFQLTTPAAQSTALNVLEMRE